LAVYALSWILFWRI